MVFLRICKGTVGVSHRQTSVSRLPARIGRSRGVSVAEGEMGMMGKLRMFVVQEPVVAASCLIAGFGLFLPAVVRPILDSFEAAKQVPQTAGIVSTAGKDQ